MTKEPVEPLDDAEITRPGRGVQLMLPYVPKEPPKGKAPLPEDMTVPDE